MSLCITLCTWLCCLVSKMQWLPFIFQPTYTYVCLWRHMGFFVIKHICKCSYFLLNLDVCYFITSFIHWGRNIQLLKKLTKNKIILDRFLMSFVICIWFAFHKIKVNNCTSCIFCCPLFYVLIFYLYMYEEVLLLIYINYVIYFICGQRQTKSLDNHGLKAIP